MTHPSQGSVFAPQSVPAPYLTYPPYRANPPMQPQLRVQPRESMAARAIPAAARRTRIQAWVIGVLLMLVVATALGVVLVLQDNASGAAGVPDPPSQGAPGDPGDANGHARDKRDVPSPPTDCLVECTEPDGSVGSPAASPPLLGTLSPDSRPGWASARSPGLA